MFPSLWNFLIDFPLQIKLMDTNSGTVLSEFSQRTLKIEIHYSKTNTNKTAKKISGIKNVT